jgi:two-component system, NarL family, response regulator
MSADIRLLIVDDHPTICIGLKAIIGTQPDMVVVAEANTGEQAVNLFKEFQPDVTLVDLRLPGMNGVAVISTIRKEFSNSRFIVLTSYDGDENIYQALQAGAKAFLLKDMLSSELLSAIRAVHAGRNYIPSSIAEQLTQRLSRPSLTPREMEVLKLIADGKSNKEIAKDLSVSEDTIKHHVSNVINKLEVADRTEAVLVAIKRGLIHL